MYYMFQFCTFEFVYTSTFSKSSNTVSYNADYILVFKVSRTFSTRLTLSESFEIDSTHSTFSTPKWLYKNRIFENFILYAKIFKIPKYQLETLEIVIAALMQKNYTYFIKKLQIFAILQKISAKIG